MIGPVAAGDDEIIELADPRRDQYFLSAPDKLELLVAAAGIQPTDRVVEIGAGIGSVARVLPDCASLTLIELDERLVKVLRRNVPQATVIQGDAFALLPSIACDVLLSNLPTVQTARLLDLLPSLAVRTAVVTTSHSSMPDAPEGFTVQQLTSIGGNDFIPPQPINTQLIKLSSTR
jgi:phospholipid N-methyltransferase